VEHAERNAIYLAARNGQFTRGAIMYAPWAPCDNCARAIIQAGIQELVGHQQIMDKTPDRWKESIDLAQGMLNEAGVKYRLIDEFLDAPEVLFDGKLWKP